MTILRTDKIAGLDSVNAITGSVNFPNDGATGTGDYLRVDKKDNSDYNLSTNDFTIEFWFNSRNVGSTLHPLTFAAPSVSASSDVGFYLRFNGGVINAYCFQSTNTIGGVSTGSVSMNTWYHVAYVRNGSTFTIYLDGTAANSASSTAAVNYNAGWNLNIGSAYTNTYHYNGYLSNVRIVNGKALYTSNFTTPTRQLEVTPETVLLCCHSSQDPTQEATGKTLTAIRTISSSGPLLSTFTPDVGKDYARFGTVLEGNVEFSSLNYMTLPRGTTTEAFVNFGGASAANARGVNGGGYTGSAYVNTIEYITISTTGNASDFGDLVAGTMSMAPMASPTRGVWAGGYQSGGDVNTIQYITIATTGNAQDFGDQSSRRQNGAGFSNSIRGCFSGSTYSTDNNSNAIDYITIASMGNAANFGDTTLGRGSMGGCASETRGIFAGGGTSGPVVSSNIIEYVTIATTSNSTDFGDLTDASKLVANASCGSSTRGLFANIGTSGFTNVIDYITIATTGNAADFGDLTQARIGSAGLSSKVRGCFIQGRSPASSPYTYHNIIDYVTIASAGNATDFGDSGYSVWKSSGFSNGHGGLG